VGGAAHLEEVVLGIIAEGGGASFADRKSVKKGSLPVSTAIVEIDGR